MNIPLPQEIYDAIHRYYELFDYFPIAVHVSREHAQMVGHTLTFVIPSSVFPLSMTAPNTYDHMMVDISQAYIKILGNATLSGNAFFLYNLATGRVYPEEMNSTEKMIDLIIRARGYIVTSVLSSASSYDTRYIIRKGTKSLMWVVPNAMLEYPLYYIKEMIAERLAYLEQSVSSSPSNV